MFPKKLKLGDTVRVISPSRSANISWISDEVKNRAEHRLRKLGLDVQFGKNIYENDEFNSSSIQHRIEDIHDAFTDKKVNMVLTMIGGFNSNQLLRHLDYEIIRKNPKILCGFSDITALSNAIYSMTGLVTYSGPHFFNFGMKQGFDYTMDYFKKVFFGRDPFAIRPSEEWSNDRWATEQDNRRFEHNPGWLVINKGKAEGRVVGGNGNTFQLLQGTEFWPGLHDTILMLEEDNEAGGLTPQEFDRNLVSLIHQQDFHGVRGILIGRFEGDISDEQIIRIVKTKPALDHIPVIANLDFGHTTPQITFPIGGKIEIDTDKPEIRIIEH